MKKLSETFNSIAVKKGEYFAVELNNSGGTGYLWDVAVTAGKATLVREETKDLSRPGPHGEPCCGGPILERTIFRAEEAGMIELQAELRRPWEKTSPPARSHQFKVSVK
jgi:predicted secreted protein